MLASRPTRSRCCALTKCYASMNSAEILLMASYGMKWETRKCTLKYCLRWVYSRNTAWVWLRKWSGSRKSRSWTNSSAGQADKRLMMITRTYRRKERRIRPLIRTYSTRQWKNNSFSMSQSRCITNRTCNSQVISMPDPTSASIRSVRSRERLPCLSSRGLKARSSVSSASLSVKEWQQQCLRY